MSVSFSKLNTKLIVVIGTILFIFLTLDILYSAKSSRDTAIHEVERWSVLLAETIRVSMNTLMKEEKMGARFVMFESMREEIPGLQAVRVIRGERVNAIFQGVRDKKTIPREQKVIADSRKKIEELSAKLKTTKDAYDRKDMEAEISDAQRDIVSAEHNLEELQRPLTTDPRELPKDPEDRQVLDSGKPLFKVDGDKMQVWSPFIARKNCGSAGGCHVGVEVGNVLGAVHMEFSLEDINKEVRRNTIISTVGKIILSLLIVGALMYMITRIILRKIGGEPDYASDVVRQVSDGDLTVQVQTHSGDTGSLLASLKNMVNKLSVLVADVRNSTESITTASQQIAAGNADLSSRTEEQAASLEQTATSMEELTSTVRQNAENAKQANQLATSASDIAVKGGKAVNEVVETMASISTSSKKIVDIIGVIEGIAFQTNILALNAAVEAARAGEQGRGFAVVASEVRNLAQRSSAAAKEIKTLIGDSVGKVTIGAKQVDQAGATMKEIVTAVKRVTDIMSEIAAASSEQSSGIEQVNNAIIHMDDVTQQNAALVEQAAAAAEAMQDQAHSLFEAVSVFQLAGGYRSARTEVDEPESDQPGPTESHGDEEPLSGNPKERRVIVAKEDTDSDWKEF